MLKKIFIYLSGIVLVIIIAFQVPIIKNIILSYSDKVFNINHLVCVTKPNFSEYNGIIKPKSRYDIAIKYPNMFSKKSKIISINKFDSKIDAYIDILSANNKKTKNNILVIVDESKITIIRLNPVDSIIINRVDQLLRHAKTSEELGVCTKDKRRIKKIIIKKIDTAF